jgi:anti-sigma B factor antagonist
VAASSAGGGVFEMQIVSLQGRITVDNGNEMRRKLADTLLPRLPKLTVDLSGVTYMDTSGLATLMEAMRIARRQGTRLVLSGIQDQPRYLLEITDLDHLFEIEKAAET